MNKILSIVVPAYNIEKYIKKCLDSFLDFADTNDLEVLIINDGSTDMTGSIVEKFCEKYPKLFKCITQENAGHGAAINTGLKYSQGKYFMIVDGDDWVNKRDFQILVGKLKKIDADLVVNNYTRVKNKTEKLVCSNAPYYNKTVKFIDLDIPKYYFVLSSICYKTEILKGMNLVLPEHIFYEDLVYIIEPMIYINNLVFLDISPYQYRVGIESQSTARENMVKNYEQHKKIVLRELEYYEENKNFSIQSQYIKSIVGKALVDNFYIMLQEEKNIKNAKKELMEFEKLLNLQYSEFYPILDEQIFLFKYLRRDGFRFLNIYRRMVAIKRRLLKG